MSKTILVVDDDPDNREAMATLLRDDGHVVVEARNGREALLLLVAEDRVLPSLIVLDLAMPVMTGQELLGILRSYARLTSIPVIVVTAVDGEVVDRAPPVARHIRKPVGVSELRAHVSEVLGR